MSDAFKIAEAIENLRMQFELVGLQKPKGVVMQSREDLFRLEGCMVGGMEGYAIRDDDPQFPKPKAFRISGMEMMAYVADDFADRLTRPLIMELVVAAIAYRMARNLMSTSNRGAPPDPRHYDRLCKALDALTLAGASVTS